MPQAKLLLIDDLKLDLRNFRTVPQPNEVSAVNAMISMKPEWFWALMESLLDDGYHLTENIIVLKTGENGDQLEVREGNRRVGALKIILGLVPEPDLGLPSHIKSRIDSLPKDWKETNRSVPCAIYGKSEEAVVDRIVTLTHGKGDKAGRDMWNAVARARHNRDRNSAKEPALDLLEKYLQQGLTLNSLQKERWSSDYPLTVLEEAMKRIAPRLGLTSSPELAEKYPKVGAHRTAVENILKDVGSETLDFARIRDTSVDFGAGYGIPPPATTATKPGGGAGAGGAATTGSAATSLGSATTSTATTTSARRVKAVSLNDPRAVSRALRKFAPRGKNREKFVTLLQEARTLKLRTHPLAFCFVLRSMFEISAKLYCDDHASDPAGPKCVKANGDERKLVEILKDVVTHLTKNGTDLAMNKVLHGPITNLAAPEGILSVTSMNQLVHNKKFSVDETHICTLFANIFPLLEAMNR